MIANKKLRGSVMNIALPSDAEDKKRLEMSQGIKRSRSEVENYKSLPGQDGTNNATTNQTKISTKDVIRHNFEQYERQENGKSEYRTVKRVKTSEKGEYGDEKPCSELTAVTHGSKNNLGPVESPFRKLSISNFEPILPKGMTSKPKKMNSNNFHTAFGTPQPVRTDNTLRNEAFLTCFNNLVFK